MPRTTTLIAFLLSVVTFASPAQESEPDPTGRWIGGFVRAGSILNCEVEIARDVAGAYQASFWIPEWVWYYDMQPQELTLGEDGLWRMNTARGAAELRLDADYGEMLGRVGESTPETTLHLKRDLARAEYPRLSIEPVTFATDVDLGGQVIAPEGDEQFPAVVFIHGRGCWGGGGFVHRGRALAERGFVRVEPGLIGELTKLLGEHTVTLQGGVSVEINREDRNAKYRRRS